MNLSFENFSLKHLKIPCDERELLETRYECKDRSIIEEVIVIS